jgi:hypothetical protein
MPFGFDIASGGVAGRDHRKGVPSNYQDAHAVASSDHGLVTVVADGCGSSKYSEYGARKAVTHLTTHFQRLLSYGSKPLHPGFFATARDQLLEDIRDDADKMGESRSRIINDYFLFTLVGAIMTPEMTTFFAIGDGVFVINGELIVLDSGSENKPAYLAYAITGSSLTDNDPSRLEFHVVRHVPTPDLTQFLVGTDGVVDIATKAHRRIPGGGETEMVGPLSQFWESDEYYQTVGNSGITTRLNLMARDQYRTSPTGRKVLEGGLLPDDTTMVVGRRTPPA